MYNLLILFAFFTRNMGGKVGRRNDKIFEISPLVTAGWCKGGLSAERCWSVTDNSISLDAGNGRRLSLSLNAARSQRVQSLAAICLISTLGREGLIDITDKGRDYLLT